MIIFNPGEAICSFIIDIPDDDLIEGEESLRVDFTRTEGGVVDVSNSTTIIDISDNEEEPRIDPSSGIVNEGDIYTLPVTFSTPLPVDLEVGVSVDIVETTADSADYALLPESGIVTIQSGTISSTLSVAIENDVDDDDLLFEDEKLVLTTDLDEILDLDPIELTINDWRENLLVASETEFEKALAMTVDSHGIITALIEDTQDDLSKAKLKSFYRTGKPVSLSDASSYVFEHDSINVTPIGIKAVTIAEVRYLSVVLQVDGLYADVHRGGTDFAVAVFKASGNDEYSLNFLKQYGSEGNDLVNGMSTHGEYLFVYGSTDGLALEGVGLSESNRGGQDGFLYKIDLTTNSLDWQRFIGTSEDEELVSIDVGNRDIVGLLETQESASDGFLRIMSTSTGVDRDGVEGEKIASLQDDQMVAVNYDGNNSRYHALFHSEGSLSTDSGRTESLSSDVQLASYDSESIFSSALSIATPQYDSASDIELVSGGDYVLVGGQTEGVFSDSEQYGKSDAFVAVLVSGKNSRLAIETITQFGSAEDDALIDIEEFSDQKFFALWSEMQTSPGKLTYRISAFSIQGRMLSDELGLE